MTAASGRLNFNTHLSTLLPCLELVVVVPVNRLPRQAIGAICLALLAGLGYWWGVQHDERLAPVLAVPFASLDFGQPWVQESFRWALPLSNTTRRTLAVEVEASCACTSVNPKTLEIPPHGSREVTLVLDLVRGTSDSSSTDEEFAVQLVARSPAGDFAPVAWQLRGQPRRAFQVTPASLYIGGAEPLAVGGEPPPRQLRVLPLVPLAKLRARCKDGNARLTVRRCGDEFLVSVVPSSARPGTHDGTIDLVGVLAAGDLLPPVPVPLRVVVEPDVYAIPGFVRFKAGASAARLRETITLQSHSRRPFQVLEAVSPCQGVVLERQQQPASCVYHVSLHSDYAYGQFNTHVAFRIQRADGTREELRIPVSLQY